MSSRAVLLTESTERAAGLQDSSLPEPLLHRLEAGAFQSLCRHLQERPQIQNMTLMTVSGFCRNCLAKWMVLEARRLVDSEEIQAQDVRARRLLDSFGYDEAARHVYAMSYRDWKRRHQTEANSLDMKRYEASQSLWAIHDQDLLQTRVANPSSDSMPIKTDMPSIDAGHTPHQAASLLSNVCCEPMLGTSKPLPIHAIGEPHISASSFAATSITRQQYFISRLRINILTVSDRAYHKEYETGDLSGPAVERSIFELLGSDCADISSAIVPDDTEAIQTQMLAWIDCVCQTPPFETPSTSPHFIFTTGGTGFGSRDVTPEATRAILCQEASGLMSFVAAECSRQTPLACLSRGTAGMIRDTFIANLPGNPTAAREVLSILLPIVLKGLGWV